MSQKEKNPVGAPTKYTPELAKRLLDYFAIPLTYEKVVGKDDRGNDIKVEKANRLPTVEGFCAQEKISKSTFHIWRAKHPELSHALGIAKQFQMNHLIQFSLDGTYNAGFAKFLAMNISDYREKIENDTTGEIKVVVPDERATKL